MNDREPNRPEPEALLSEANKEGRGKLRIFLGAAPGVGKTYAMLEAARQRKAEGRDIVVGIVETHGREETESLIEGLEVLPRHAMPYRGKVFQEMDIDALLLRRPEIALVDELAHTNVEGSRHPKRYQDVEELLAAGIDVYTTLNIQHVESLNEIVQRITWVKIRETLPDSVLKAADEIKLVDVSPEELIQRLREGKVYMPDQAQMAIRHYFAKGNLTALRELAMRAAAEHVDSDLIGYMKTHGVSGIWPVRERLIACIDESPHGADIVRMASRKAARDKIAWIALHVESGTDYLLTEGERDNIDEALRLAEKMGGESVTIKGGAHIADDILAFARSRNATQLLIGRSGRPMLSNYILPSVSRQIVMKAREFDITILHATDRDKNESGLIRHVTGIAGKPAIRDFGFATLAALTALVVAWGLQHVLPLPNMSLVFLIPVLFSGVRYGLWPSLYAAVLGVSLYNFFFTEPVYTFNVYKTGDLATLAFFLVVAVVTGNMAVRLKSQLEALRASARRNAQMHDFSRKLASALTLDDITQEAARNTALDLKLSAAVLMPEPQNKEKLYVAACHPSGAGNFSHTDWGAAEWAWKNGKPAGAGSDTLPAARWYFVPLRGAKGTIALLGTAPPQDQNGGELTLSPAQRRVLMSFGDQAAMAIERSQLADDLEEGRILAETEKLRSALLSSISHDLRTPLVSIIGSTTTMQALGESLPPHDRQELLKNVIEEAERLNRFIQNLLDMTKLGHGGLQPKREWTECRDIVGRALKRVRRDMAERHVDIATGPGFSTLFADPVLMEQVFVNILENAAKYTPPGTPIRIAFKKTDRQATVTITDQGPGIPPNERDLVFDMFYRVRSADTKIAGTGLGLAICRGLIEAHGGTIHAESGPEGTGTAIVMNFPAAMAGGPLARMGKGADD